MHSMQQAPVVTGIFSHCHAVKYLMTLQAVVTSLNVIAKPLMAMILFTVLPCYYQLSHYSSKDLEHNLKWLRFSRAIASALNSD